jgi:hypothetical protein
MPDTVLSLISVFNVLFHKIIYTLSLSGAPSSRSRRLFSITRPPAGLKPRRNVAGIKLKGAQGMIIDTLWLASGSFINGRVKIHCLVLLKA